MVGLEVHSPAATTRLTTFCSDTEKEEDRISKLPDSILCHILSFLPTLSCVRTSCLSRRWRFLWKSVPVLQFDCLDYEFQFRARDRANPYQLFENFVNTVFMLRTQPSIRRFSLFLPTRDPSDINTAAIHSWILAACTPDLEEIDVLVLDFFRIMIPRVLFDSERLVSLKLSSCIVLDVPEFVNLPSLKVLHLRFPVCRSYADVNRIIHGSPLLEDLDIEVMSNSNDIQTLSILSSSLKRFALRNELFSTKDFYAVILDAPQLKFLYLVDNLSLKPRFEIENLLSITEAAFDFIYCGDSLLEHCWLRKVPMIEQFNTEVLSMSLLILLKALAWNTIDKLHCWVNLIRLDLNYCGADLKILPHILESFPNLKYLKLRYLNCNHKIECEALKKETPEIYCLKNSLKMIELGPFEGKEAEMRITEYFLKTAKVLKKITIFTDKELGVEVLKKLLMFPRCSETCQVAVS